METTNKTALITGASGGIGYELAKFFARDNYNLVIVARNEEALNIVAEQFRVLGAPKVTVIVKDLIDPASPADIYNQTVKMGIYVDVLVNNAGVGQYGLFNETKLADEFNIIQLNICALIHLTKLYLKDMLMKNEGKIVQVACLSSYQPTPLLSVYAATKAFVLSFTDSLINELQYTNVSVTALIPGPTKTDFFRKAGAENSRASNENPDNAKEVAAYAYAALMRGDKHAVAPDIREKILRSSKFPHDTINAQGRKNLSSANDDENYKRQA